MQYICFDQYNVIKFGIMKIKAHPDSEIISRGSAQHIIITALTKALKSNFLVQ